MKFTSIEVDYSKGDNLTKDEENENIALLMSFGICKADARVLAHNQRICIKARGRFVYVRTYYTYYNDVSPVYQWYENGVLVAETSASKNNCWGHRETFGKGKFGGWCEHDGLMEFSKTANAILKGDTK